MQKNNIDLIWSVAELASLFGKETSLEDFLSDVVGLIATHMQADACSIFLYDENADTLVLRATRGLNKESVGSLKLNLGEGITGTALKELRPIREGRSKDSPYYMAVPNINEERYESMLAVPIKRGLTRIGAMVLHHGKPDYFDMQDTRAIQAIASQLAATLENVEILMEIHGERTARATAAQLPAGTVIQGKPVSTGLSAGKAVSFGRRDARFRLFEHEHEFGDEGLSRFRRALKLSQEQLEALQIEVEDEYSDVASLIFSSHLLMMRDEEFVGRMQREIENGLHPEPAVVKVVNEYVDIFTGSDNARLREKTQDVKDLGHRIIRNLSGAQEEAGDYRHQIVIASELFPSELLRIAAQHAEGVILMDGGMTAHISILARSFGLPVVLTRDERIFQLPEETQLIVDAHQGTIYVSPDEEVQEAFAANLRARGEPVDADALPAETFTRDGVRIEIQANINISHDVKTARRYKAESIGLYRSEFPFLVRNDFPGEDEQYRIYRRVIGTMGKRDAVLRTLDIGGDKLLAQPELAEPNPFLGFRGIRFSLGNEDLFRDQLRAMLRAGRGVTLKILLPLVSSVDEFLASREILDRCLSDLAAEGVPHNEEPLLGAMVELPAAVEAIEGLCRHADFLSVGTNDLVMYMLAVDRTNERIGFMYKDHHPAVLRVLERIVRTAAEYDTPVSICGDAAADPAMLDFLLGVGFRLLSVEPAQVPKLKRAVTEKSVADAQRVARTLLGMETLAEVESFMHGSRG
ncbi:MAG: phosphoenolpyruvate--protein phosphotransferase [Spirochaetaceae bacterium]